MLTVKTAMTPSLISIDHRSSVAEARELMAEKRIRHLPVLGDNGDILGMIAERDLLHLDDLEGLTVEMLMSSPAHAVDVATPLRTAVFKMLEKKISCLLVSDSEDEVVGLITTDDLLWYLTHLLVDEDEDLSLENVFNIQTASRVGQQIADMGI